MVSEDDEGIAGRDRYRLSLATLASPCMPEPCIIKHMVMYPRHLRSPVVQLSNFRKRFRQDDHPLAAFVMSLWFTHKPWMTLPQDALKTAFAIKSLVHWSNQRIGSP